MMEMLSVEMGEFFSRLVAPPLVIEWKPTSSANSIQASHLMSAGVLLEYKLPQLI